MGKCYLVTGAGGRLGHNFVLTLCKKNLDNVSGLKLLDLKFPEHLRNKQEVACKEAGIEVDWINGSITDKDLVNSVLESVDVVLHMASVIDVNDSVPEKTLWDVNYGGTINLIEACCLKSVHYFVYTSSMEAVGPNADRDPLYNGNEDSDYKYNPPSEYGKTKHEAEKFVLKSHGRKMNNGKTLVTCALRPPGLYGGEDPILRMSLKLAGKKKILYNISTETSLQQRMNIENAAWSHVIAAEKIQSHEAKLGGNVYFLGDETPRSSYSGLNLQFFKPFGYTQHKRQPFLPYWILLVMCYMSWLRKKFWSLFGIKSEMILSLASLKSATSTFTFSHKKFEMHFGYKPLLTWEESLEKTREDVGRILQTI